MNRIKEIFLKLFGKERKKLDSPKAETNKNIEENGSEYFINSLKSKYIDKDEEENRKLFLLFRKRIIKEDELTEIQKQKISEIYDIEIEKLEKETDNYKNKILNYKKIIDSKKINE